MTTNPQPIGDAFQRAVEHWRRYSQVDAPAPKETAEPRLTVAFSREAGAGGNQIACELAARLKWPLYDRELVERIAEDAGLSTQMVDSVDEHRSSFIIETLEAFTGATAMGGAGYAHRLRKTLAGLGAHGDCVIIGRGATAILPRPTTASIRIVAAMNDRIAEYVRRHQVNQQTAKSDLRRLDKERSAFVRQYFHKDIDDPHGYDLVVNTSDLDREACVDLCLRAVQLKEAQMQQSSPQGSK